MAPVGRQHPRGPPAYRFRGIEAVSFVALTGRGITRQASDLACPVPTSRFPLSLRTSRSQLTAAFLFLPTGPDLSYVSALQNRDMVSPCLHTGSELLS